MSDIGAILDNIRCNSSVLSNYHRKRYLLLKGRLKYYRLPIIVISAINSVGAVALQPFIEQGYISLINMFLSLTCGIIGSIEMFFQFSKQMEVELTGSKEFYVLSTDIYKWLQLKPENRSVDGNTFLTDCYSRYIKLIESSIILKKRVEDKLVDIPTLCNQSAASSPSSIPLTISTDTFQDGSETSSDNNI
tara:strand:- start:286 stop:858 length:573 start_codon:yes stop_codon:yes gene_type:complete